MCASGHAVVVIGHAGHEEVEGTLGWSTQPVHLVASLADIARLPMRDRGTRSPTSPRPP